MGNVIYVDFIQRKPIVNVEQRLNLVMGNLDHYGKLAHYQIALLNAHCGVLEKLLLIKGKE